MNRLCSFSCLLSLLAGWYLPTQAQVSFFQPPTYSGGGNLFVADFNGDGKSDILAASLASTLDLGNGDGTFQPGTAISGVPLAVADFNGDGRPDILEEGTGTLLVMLGNGDGTFQSAISSPSNANLLAVAAVDLNGDGKADVIGVYNSSLLVYINNGDGTFQSPVSYNLGVNVLTAPTLSLGDFNGDGNIDVVVSVSGDNVAGEEIAFLGNGNGTFQTTAKVSTGTIYPGYSATGDFNGDGKLDLALSTWTCSSACSVQVFLGNGDGTFTAPTSAFTGYGSIAAADLNGDGKVDLVLDGNTVGQVYLGNGDGTFTSDDSYILTMPNAYSPAYGATGIAVADFNHDGKIDLAMNNAVLLGNGDGSFQGVTMGVVPAVSAPSSIAVGDFNNNGRIGVAAVSGNGVYVLNNNGAGILSLAGSYTMPQTAYTVSTADFNGDGNLDLLVLQINQVSQDWSYSVLLGNGNGTFQSPSSPPPGGIASGPLEVVVADFNNDHILDFAVIGLTNQSLAVLIGKGDGTFNSPVLYFNGGGTSLLPGDYNSDGKLDLAVGTQTGTGILFGNGDGTFQPVVFPASLNNFFAQFTADINNDGKADLISNQVALGNGDGTFKVLNTLATNQSILGIADLNGDGNLDVVVELDSQTGHSSATELQLGNGDGTFRPLTPLIQDPPNGTMYHPVFGDMNGDGHVDILFPWDTISDQINGVGMLLNSTVPGFQLSASALSPATIGAGSSASSTVIATTNFGFSSAVTLGCLGLPAGTTCTFTPASLSGAGNAALAITTAAGTPAGVYPIQIQGVAGSLTSIVSLSLTVQAPADFGLSTASGSFASQSVSAGQAAQYSVSIAPNGSFSGTIDFACSIAPAANTAPTCKLSNSSMQISGTSSQTLTVTVATTAPQNVAGTSYAYPVSGSWLPTCATILLGTIGLFFVRRSRRTSLAAMSVILLILLFSVSCGGNGSTSSRSAPGTPAGTYTVTVTGTSGSISHQLQLQLTVK